MENTPTGRADDLPTILRIFKNDPKSKSVNNSLRQLDFHPNSITYICLPAKAPPRLAIWTDLTLIWTASFAISNYREALST